MTLGAVRRFALSLPDAAEEPHFHYDSYRVRGKIFVTVPPDGTHVHVFVAGDTLAEALASHPECVEELRWGTKVAGVRVELASAPAALVTRLMRAAWMRKAPASLRGKVG